MHFGPEGYSTRLTQTSVNPGFENVWMIRRFDSGIAACECGAVTSEKEMAKLETMPTTRSAVIKTPFIR